MAFDELGWEPPEVTPELATLIEHARDTERALLGKLRLLSTRQLDALVRKMVVGGADGACEPPLDPHLGIDELCEACLEVRGPIDRGDDRSLMREHARIHLRLVGDSPAMRSPRDLLALWDEATLRELRIRLFVEEPRWRTAADGVPFTGTRMAALLGPIPLVPGQETADPADIPQLVEVIAGFARRDDLPPEVVALGMYYLIFRIHPFADSNGHTIRMLACDIMHRAGYCEPTLHAYIDARNARHEEMGKLSIDVALGRATPQDHIAFHLNVVLQAQEAVSALL